MDDVLQPARTARLGGVTGNARLTSLIGMILLVLLAVEGATIPFLGPLRGFHILVGLLLLGPVAFKLASVGYKMLSYYGHRTAYVRRGPPHMFLRAFVGPLLVVSTIVMLGSGVALLYAPDSDLIGLAHKASFILWFGAMTLHFFAHIRRASRDTAGDLTEPRTGGRVLRYAAAALAIGLGVVVAVAFGSL